MISHIISLACDDDAYALPDMTPRTVPGAGRPKGLELPTDPLERGSVGRARVSRACINDHRKRTITGRGALLRSVSRVGEALRGGDRLRPSPDHLLSSAGDGERYQR